MREAIGSTWIYSLVVVFILLFVGFLVLALSYSKSFKTKNELINIIERHEGVNTKSVEVINRYLDYNGYSTKGYCPNDKNKWLASNNLNSSSLVSAKSNEKYYYCVRREYSTSPKSDGSSKTNNKKVYYDVMVFFKFNLPVINNISTFRVDGITGDIIKSKDLFDSIKS